MVGGETEGAVRNNPAYLNLEAAEDFARRYGACGRNAFGKPGIAISGLRNMRVSSSDKNG
jgi:hypothetical protein